MDQQVSVQSALCTMIVSNANDVFSLSYLCVYVCVCVCVCVYPLPSSPYEEAKERM